MAVVLGKRKTRPSEEESAEALAKAQAIFQRHFESTFQPLDLAPLSNTAKKNGDGDDEDHGDNETDTDPSDSEWDGLSGDEDGMPFPFSHHRPDRAQRCHLDEILEIPR